MNKKAIKELIQKNQAIKLDLGCGSSKQNGFCGMDIRKVSGVDIVHDIEDTPYPLPNECCSMILASHVMEHICPKKHIRVMNELWRIMKPEGQLWVSLPYMGSQGFNQDPTHCHSYNQATPLYFDPMPENLPQENVLYNVYRPLPWKIVKNAWNANGNMEVIYSKRSLNEKNS